MKYLATLLLLVFVSPAFAESALIANGRVAQVSDPFPVHRDLKWVDISAINPKPKPGWFYDGSVFSAPPVKAPLTDQEKFDRQVSRVEMKALIRALMEMRGKTEAEIKAWLKSKL